MADAAGSPPAPVVSVVIPTKDRPALVRTTVLANLAQTGPALEVIVVDDGSSTDIAAALADVVDHRLRVLRMPRSVGVSAARNAGLAVAAGTWVSFCDDDDLPAPAKLQAQLDALAARPAAVWSCVETVRLGDGLRPIGIERVTLDGDVADVQLAHNIVPGGGSGVLARADVVRALGGFDEALSMHADYDMRVRLAMAGDLAAVREPLLGYRVHAASMSESVSSVAPELARVLAKHAPARASRAVTWDHGHYRIWHAERQQRAHRRVVAARSWLGTWRQLGVVRAVALAAESFLAPGAYVRREARWQRSVDPVWAAGVERWLAPIRAGAA